MCRDQRDRSAESFVRQHLGRNDRRCAHFHHRRNSRRFNRHERCFQCAELTACIQKSVVEQQLLQLVIEVIEAVSI
jgi:hypothetical protein